MNYKLILILIFLAVFTFVPKIKGQVKNGYITTKYSEPKCAHITNFRDGGKVKRIRGRLFLGLEKPFEYSGIVALYEIIGEKEIFRQSFITETDGKFRFKNLKKGTYLLKTGSIIEHGFNCLDIKVVLAPKDKNSSNKDLEISVELGT